MKDAKKVDQICESWGEQLRPTATSLLLLCACRPELTTTAKTLVEKCDALVSEEQADGLSALKVARASREMKGSSRPYAKNLHQIDRPGSRWKRSRARPWRGRRRRNDYSGDLRSGRR